ncbi:MAG: BatD family protein [Xanthomonadales bacterium]|nr:BatD family protein [Xanthomonadales bacterium]
MRLANLLILLSVAASGFAQTELSARLSRDTIFDGESVTLIIEGSGSPRGMEPDYSVLEGKFYLGDTTTSSQLSMVQGRRELRTQWAIELEPRSTGTVEVPAVAVGQLRTSPLQLKVLPRGQARDGAEEVFLEMDVSNRAPYVSSQVLLTIRLYHVNALTEGRLIEPPLPDAVVERLGEDVADSAEIEGTRYRVLVRRFAVFPERSGTMTIPPARFRGRVADNRGGFNSIFDRGRRVSVASEAVELEVQPRPPGYAGNWLPAAELTLEESWPDDQTRFVVGEPTTRRLILKAKGLLAVQLPEIELPELGEVKIYPDKAQSQSRTDGSWVYGEREQGYALVPNSAGTLRLPEIRIPWWDTVNDEMREAVIPAREIVVQPGALGVTPPPTPADIVSANPGGAPQPGYWRWIALGALALWLATLAAWQWERRGARGNGRTSDDADRLLKARQWRSRLRAACDANDPDTAARALIGWATVVAGQPVRNLGSVAQRIPDPEARRAVLALDEVLYREPGETWDGTTLGEQVRQDIFASPTAETSNRVPVLKPLYPEA